MPRYGMPLDPLREATVREVEDALCAARCSAQLAGLEADQFVVRELLLTAIQQIDRAVEHVRRLHVSA